MFFYNTVTQESTWDSPYKNISKQLSRSFHSQASAVTLGSDDNRPQSQRYAADDYDDAGAGAGAGAGEEEHGKEKKVYSKALSFHSQKSEAQL